LRKKTNPKQRNGLQTATSRIKSLIKKELGSSVQLDVFDQLEIRSEISPKDISKMKWLWHPREL
jgi:hypothetical protein